MVPMIIVAGWIFAAVAAGVGVGRVIARADRQLEHSDLDRELREVTAR
jgi:hypothetical protein